ncbi:MAG: UbiD family decarboxylase [Candidatus Thermoplasmatota archaeon]|jgi:UbiD family decarboxylase|nr:UbiD family decarboxylase [Candidatus Thermoplasmatota archaeon]
MKNWTDLRDWIVQAEEIQELKTIEGSSLNLELSAIAQVNAKNSGPALLFQNFREGEFDGFRVLTNSVGNYRLFNLTFGFPQFPSISETIQNLKGKPSAWEKESEKFPVNFVEKGQITENIMEGDSIDLNIFPTPLWHDRDGGRFIGTGVAVITADPDDGKINVGSYRAQLFDSKTIGLNIERGKHGASHREKYFSQGKPMPVVLIFGPDPLLYILAGSEIPTGVSELEYYGAIKGKRMNVIRGKKTGLPIPAGAEIAVEGFVYPDRTRLEGPHGEWTGYYASDAKEKPYLSVDALYYRNNAIMLGSAMSRGSYNDHASWRSIWKSALIYDELLKNGIPGIKGVYCPSFGVGRQFINISIEQMYPGHATEAGYMASQTRSAAYMGKWVVVVDEDVNPYDMDDVLWAMCSRADPAEIGIIRKGWASGVDPLRPRDLPASKYTNSRGIIFAVVPYERKDSFPGRCEASPEIRNEVFQRYHNQLDGRWTLS